MTDPVSEFRSGGEFRVAGRTLQGTVLRYGDIEPDRRERFEPGAFSPVPAVPLNLQHDPGMVIVEAGEYDLQDTPAALEIRAVLGEQSAALKLARRKILTGFSVEFQSVQERRDSGTRIIETANLVGIGLVDSPAYPGSTAEVRRRGDRGGRLATFRGNIPVEEQVECKCLGGGCEAALFRRGAFDSLPGKSERDVLAVVGDYGNAIGSKKRKSVRFWHGKDGALEYAVDVPNNARGRALMETFEEVDTLARPVLDEAASQLTRAGPLATYSRAHVRALTIGPTDAAKGWTPLRLREGDDDDLPDAPERPPAKRRAAIWRM